MVHLRKKTRSRPTIPGRTEDNLPLLPSGPGGVRLHPRRPRILDRLPFDWRRGWDLNPRYRSRYTRFPVVHLRPLGHLSSPCPGWRSAAPGKKMADSEGFEPPVPLPVHLISSQAPSTSSASCPPADLTDFPREAKHLSPRSEELPEEGAALLAPHPALHLEAVVQAGVLRQVHERAHRAGLG